MSTPERPAQHPYDRITVEDLVGKGGIKWAEDPEVIGAFIAETDFGVAEPIRRALREMDARDLFGYAPPWMIRDLQQATAELYAREHGWEPPAEWIAPLPDVVAGFSAVLEMYADPRSPVILPTPAYMPFLEVPRLQGRRIIEVPMHRDPEAEIPWRLDLEELDAAFAQCQDAPGVLVLCNPHNPTGKVHTREEMLGIAEVVHRRGGRVFSDEIHGPVVYAGARHVPYASVSERAASHALTATAASKAFNIPGLRCAQLIFSNPDDAALWRERGTFVSKSASNPGMLATVAAYRDSCDWAHETRDYLQGTRDELPSLLDEHLPGASMILPESTFLAWIDLSGVRSPRLREALAAGRTAQQLLLEEAKVSLTDGALCGRGSEAHVRLNFGMPRPVLREAFARMGRALA